MEPISITHYVEKSFDGKPSFVILMSDQNEYISNGCVFIENTAENIEFLIAEYACKNEIEMLLQSKSVANDELTNGRHMYSGCTNLTTAGDYPLLKNGYCMYYGCTNLTTAGDYPLLTSGGHIYDGCTNLIKS